MFDYLLAVVKRYNLNTTLRVAGGWVRDKVLHCTALQYILFLYFFPPISHHRFFDGSQIQLLQARAGGRQTMGGHVMNGKGSDLDIALDNMMGKDFCSYITQYNMEMKFPPSKYGCSPLS